MKKVKLKKRKNKLRFKRKIVLTSTLVLLFVIGIGYSFLSINLNILGNITVRKSYGKTLYEVLEKEASFGGLAKKHTGLHQDSMDPTKSTEIIYHWYAKNDNEGTEIQNKNNVIFANHCWQMIRTTDTGGVKLIYNGEPENNQCLDSRGNHVGYNGVSIDSLSSSSYYGTSYTYDKINNVFSLDGTITTGSVQIGQYTCNKNTANGTCSSLKYVDSYNNSTYDDYYLISLSNSSHYSQFGEIRYNKKSDSPSYEGYMYNTVYTHKERPLYDVDEVLKKAFFYVADYVADSYSYSNGVYSLVNPYKVTEQTDPSSLIGKYSLFSSRIDATGLTINYIATIDSQYVYAVELSGGNNLNYYNNTYTYGDSYTDNGNGTYTINSPNTIRTLEFDNHANLNNKYVCKNAINNTCTELWHVGNTTINKIHYNKPFNSIIYSNSFSYSNGVYTLDSTNRVQFWNSMDTSNINLLGNNHYTCFNDSGTCTTIYYVYYCGFDRYFYIELENGKSVENAINEMFFDDNVNTTNSTIKTGIDLWYEKYMIDYTPYIDDVIYCSDRRISDLGGWDPNGGKITNSTTSYLDFGGSDRLKCANVTDSFSLTNPKAQLKYPVGLIYEFLFNSNYARKTGANYWTMILSDFNSNASCVIPVSSDGRVSNSYVYDSRGLRPVIALRPGTEYISGTGSKADPYVVNTFKDDDWATIVNNVRNGNTANYQVGDTKEVDMGSLGTHTLRIANKSTPNECNNSDFSETSCGFVLEFADIITEHITNSTITNVGGWPATEMRTYVNSDIYNALPSDLKNGIINTRVVSGHGSSDSNNFTSTDKLYLLTTKELNGVNVMDTAAGKTRQLDYYNNLGISGQDIRVAKRLMYYDDLGSIVVVTSYRVRNTRSDSNSSFYGLGSDGMWFSNSPRELIGVSPAFRIG